MRLRYGWITPSAILIITCLTLLLGTVTLADDGAIGTVGGALTPMNDHPSVRMVREDVHVKIINTPRQEGGIRVSCRFVFRNEGAPTTVKMGFPEEFDGNSNGFFYFRSKVDGRRVSVRKVSPTDESRPRYRGWRVKNVRFGRNQTRIVEDTYGGGMGGSIAGDRSLIYILTTGRSWHGPIGEAVVTVDTTAFKDWQTMVPSPSGYRQRGNTLTWRFRNFEPSREIEVRFWPGYSKFIVNGKNRSALGILTQGGEWMPYMERGLVVAPPEFVGSLLNQRVEDLRENPGDVRHAKLKIGGTVISLTAGDRNAVIGEKTIILPRAPYVRKSKYQPSEHKVLVAPIGPILRAFGETVTFSPKTGTTYINTQTTH